MTSGVDWVEDHRDPVGPATALVSRVRRGRLVAGAVGPGRRPLPAGHPLRVLHRRFAGARLGARARHRRAVRRGAAAAVARPGLHRGRRGRRRRGRGGAGRRRAWPPSPRTGPGSGCCRSTVSCPTAAAARPRLGRRALPAVAAVPRPRPAAQHAVRARRVRLPLVAAGRAGRAGQRRRQPRPVRLPRPAARGSSWSRPRPGPTPTPAHDRQCRDLSYLALAAIVEPPAAQPRRRRQASPQSERQ